MSDNIEISRMESQTKKRRPSFARKKKNKIVFPKPDARGQDAISKGRGKRGKRGPTGAKGARRARG